MRFKSIKLKNYRQYQDVQLSFPKTKDTDLHMIIASNGVGKTNLMNAINWCLYGDEPHLGDSKDSLPIYNIDSLKEAQQDNIDKLTISVEIIVEDNANKYTICRKQDVIVKTKFLQIPKMNINYYDRNGETVILEGDDADGKINQLLPRSIREYFFFDAEQLYNYFDAQKNSTTFVKDAINTIAQVTLLNKAYDHLNIYSKKNYKTRLNKLHPDLESISDDIEKIEQDIQHYTDGIEQLEEQIQLSVERIAEINKLINGAESVVSKNQRYQENCNRLDDLEQKEQNAIDELRTLIQKYIPLLYLYNINSQVKQFVASKGNALPPELDIKVLKKSLADHICACCGRKIDEETENRFKQILDKIDTSNDVIRALAGIRPIVEKSLEKAEEYKKAKDGQMDLLNSYDKEKRTLEEENQSLNSFIEQHSDISNIENLMKERDSLEKTRGTNNQKIGSYKTQLELKKRELKDKKRAYQTALKEQNDSKELSVCIEFLDHAASVIKEISDELVHEVKQEMEKETYRLFRKFIYHGQEKFRYADVKLTDNYKLQLIHSETKKSCLGSCSAAERQMLALSFTIALHRVSGFDSLLFIDTPVGRVSDINRKNFAKMLVELSKEKQMIFTFTPSEFSEEIRGYFNEQVCSSYRELKGSPLVYKE